MTGLGLVSTGAYDTVSADRGVQVDTVSDPNALLGFTGYGDTSKTPTFTNNTNHEMNPITLDSTADVEFDVGTDGTYVAPPVDFSLASGASKEVDIQFTGSCTNAGSADVSTDATLKDSGGATVGSISLTRTWKIPQSGQVQVTPNVKSTGNSGKYEYELENTGCFDVVITGLGINETTEPTADKVGGKNKDDILTQGGTQIVSTQIPVDNSNPDSATIRAFDSNVPLAQGQTKTFEFDRFRTASNSNAKMKDEDVKLTLEFDDGSTKIVKLCPNSCSI